MAYLNTIYITDAYAIDLLKETTNVANINTIVDKAVERFCQSKGVAIDNIPVDEEGYATSYIVIEYARYKMYIELFCAYRGTARGETEDIYMSKKEEYEEKLSCIKSEATRASILNDEDTDRSTYVGSVVIY